jgi:CRP-like cAMP-binding protein
VDTCRRCIRQAPGAGPIARDQGRSGDPGLCGGEACRVLTSTFALPDFVVTGLSVQLCARRDSGPDQPMPDGYNTPMEMLARKLDSIARLAEADRDALLHLPHTVRNLPARHDIVRFGDRPNHSCLVLQGWVYRYAALSEGGRQILSFYIAGDLPDLQSLHLHRMDHNLATLTASVVALIAHDDLRPVLLRNPGLAATLWRDSLIDAAHYRERITSLGRRQALGRVAHLFCELYLRQKAVGLARDLSCPLVPKQSELADALGLTSVHLNRVLRTLRGRGLVTLSGGILTIEDWDALTEVAEFDPTFLHLANNPAPVRGIVETV